MTNWSDFSPVEEEEKPVDWAAFTPVEEPAEPQPDAQFVSGSRGKMRGGAAPYVAGDDGSAARADVARRDFAAKDPRRVDANVPTILDRPAPPDLVAKGDAALARDPSQQISPAGAAKAAALASRGPRIDGALRPLDTAGSLALDAQEISNPVARGAISGLSQLGQTGIGATRLVADLVGADGLAEFAGGASKGAATVARGATEGLGGNAKLAADITSSIINSAPTILLGMASGPAMPALFAQSAMAEYNEGRNSGFGVAESAARAGVMGAAEVIGERFGFSQQIQLFKGAVAGASKAEMSKLFGQMIAREIPGEQLTTLIQFMGDKFGPAAQNPEATLAKYLEQAGDTLAVTIGQTAIMGGGPTVVAAAREAFPQKASTAFGKALRDDIRDTSYTQEGALQQAMSYLDTSQGSIDPRLTTKPLVRVEDMPTTPLAPEQIQAIAAANPRPAADPKALAEEAAAAPMQPLGVAAVAQGSLADMAEQQLGRRTEGGADGLAGPAGVVAGGDAAPGDQPGGGGSDQLDVPGVDAGVGATAAKPAAGGVEAGPLGEVDKSDSALNLAQGLDTFKSKGQALTWAVQNRIAHRVDVMPAPDGKGFVLAPKARQADAATLEGDANEVATINAETAKLGWRNADGSQYTVTPVRDSEAPSWFAPVQRVAEAAFGIRVLPAVGFDGEGVQYGGRAYVNARNTSPGLVIGLTGHESLHWLEVNDPKAAATLRNAIVGTKGKPGLLKGGVVAARMVIENANLTKGEKPMSKAGATSEILGDINGSMWVDPEFWGKVYELDNGSTMRKVMYQFMRAAAKVVRVATGSRFDVSQYVTDAEAVRNVSAKVWAERAQAPRKALAKASTKAPVESSDAPAQARDASTDWAPFPTEMAGKGVPRSEMPQVKVAKRPALFEHLSAMGITSKRETAAAKDLKPTQAEYSQSKTDSAKDIEPGGDRDVVMVSSDGYVLDGHHRWLAAAQQGKGVQVVRFSAPIDRLMDAVWRFPDTTVSNESGEAEAGAVELSDKRKAKINDAAAAARKWLPGNVVNQAVKLVSGYAETPEAEVPAADRKRLEAVFKPVLERAAQADVGFGEVMDKLGNELGAEIAHPPIKGMKRLVEKMYSDEQGGDGQAQPDWAKDTVRATIIVGSEAEVTRALAALKKAMNVVRVKDRFERPLETGYSDILTNVELPNGMLGEVQINVPSMLAAKELGHLVYEIRRALSPGAEATRARMAEVGVYGSARKILRGDETRSSNSASDTSMPSRTTRPQSSSLPDLTQKQVRSGSMTTGISSTSTSLDPGGRDFQSYIEGSPAADGSSDIIRQARWVAPKFKPDPAVAADVSKRLRLTKAEAASTSLRWQTGKPKRDAFSLHKEGGIPKTITFLEDQRLASGLPALDLAVEGDREQAARLMTAEALAAIRGAGNAVEWYDKTISKTIGRMSTRFPELRTDPDARTAFLLTMAITSQGLNVENNLSAAIKIYPTYRDTGRFAERGEGESEAVMAGNFRLLNQMLDEFGGMGEMARFLATPFTVGELKQMGYKIGGELIDEEVLGSSVLGPKIGFGFFSNLTGNFEPVTMDMWFMRTVGRLIGRLKSFDAARFKGQTDKFLAALDEVGGADGLYADSFDQDMVNAAREQIEGEDGKMEPNAEAIADLARIVNARHQKDFKDNRSAFDAGTRRKTDLVLASGNIIKSLDKPKDAPASGGERRLLRDIVRRVVDKVAKAHGQRVPPAALQALIWYPEQELYSALGVPLAVTSQDYAGAALKTLTEGGFSESAVTTNDDAPSPPRAVPLSADEKAEIIRRKADEMILKSERANPKRTRLFFEVAPDPNNQALTDRWRVLPQIDRQVISRRVMRAIVPKVLGAYGNSAVVLDQTGSYLDDTNPSFGLLLKKAGGAVDIANELGFVLSQDSMMLLSPKPFKGGFESGAVVIAVGNKTPAEIDAIYQVLRGLRLSNGEQISGQSTANGMMTIMVPAGDANSFANYAHDQLGGAYTVFDEAVYAAFPEKKDYDYGSPQDDPRGKAGLARQRARALRAEASSLVASELGGPRQARVTRQAGTAADSADQGRVAGPASGEASKYAGVADPFAAGYSALEGRKVTLKIRIADTGQIANFTVDAAQYMRDIDERRDTARQLAACIAR